MIGLNIIFAVLTWFTMFLIIPFKRIKKLFPVGFVSAGLLFISQYIFITLNLIHYTKSTVFIADMPLFQLIASFAFGILLIHFMKEEWVKKIPVLVTFTLVNEVMALIVSKFGTLKLLNGFNLWIDTIVTLAVFSLGVWICEGLWKDRIYKDQAV